MCKQERKLSKQVLLPSLRAPIWAVVLGAVFQFGWPICWQVQGGPGKLLPLGRPLLLCAQPVAVSVVLQGPSAHPAQRAGIKRRIIAKAEVAASPRRPQAMGGKGLKAGKGTDTGLQT